MPATSRASPDRDQSRDTDGGMVTIEAAVALCAFVTVLAMVLAGVSMVLDQIRCVDAAREAARLVAGANSPAPPTPSAGSGRPGPPCRSSRTATRSRSSYRTQPAAAYSPECTSKARPTPYESRTTRPDRPGQRRSNHRRQSNRSRPGQRRPNKDPSRGPPTRPDPAQRHEPERQRPTEVPAQDRPAQDRPADPPPEAGSGRSSRPTEGDRR